MISKVILRTAAAVAFLLFGFGPARADAIYSYQGRDFVDVLGGYTTSESVTGSITLSSALSANLVDQMITPASFTFSDGLQTITNASPNLTEAEFFVWTDAAGNITMATTFAIQGGVGYTFQNGINTGTLGGDDVFQSTYADPAAYQAADNYNGGVWTEVAAVPEPSTWAMMILGFLGVSFMAYRKKGALRFA